MTAQLSVSENRSSQRSGDLKVLLVEDNALDAKWVARGLKQATGATYSVYVLDAVSHVPAFLKINPVDVIVMDLNLPDSNGWQTVSQIANAKPGTAIVVLSGQADFATVRDALLAGAQTYQLKDVGTHEALAERIDFAIKRKKREIELARRYIGTFSAAANC